MSLVLAIPKGPREWLMLAVELSVSLVHYHALD